MGRPRTCDCGECRKCKHRERARLAYQAKSPEERQAVYQAQDRVKARARDRERSKKPERIAHITRNTRRWRKEHPERVRAHSAVAYALRTGKLVKEPCEVCGSTERVHAHHDDYAKRLEVRWLCPLHHAAERE